MYTVENWGPVSVQARVTEKTEKVVSEKSKKVIERTTAFKKKLRQKELARIEARKK